MNRTRRSKGAIYEDLAARFLTSQGFAIIERNWRCLGGELDLVAADGDTLAFVEVRSRRAGASYRPEESVSPTKMRRLVLAAEAYLASHPWSGPCRFDVVAVDIRPAGATARLIKDAFSA